MSVAIIGALGPVDRCPPHSELISGIDETPEHYLFRLHPRL